MSFDLNTLLSAELHDIKNLMQGLNSCHETLAEQLQGQALYQDNLANIQLHSQNLNHRLIELLSILKLQNPDFNCSEDEHWLIDTLTPLMHEFKQLNNLHIQANFDAEFNGFYDEQLLEIALRNIFTNANRAGATQVLVDIQEFDDGSWLIQLTDNGPGFKSEHLKQDTFTPQGAESGLGLYLIEQAVSAHIRAGKTGKMKLDNHENGGAITQLLFP